MHPFYGPANLFLETGSFWWVGLLSMVLYLVFWAAVIFVVHRFVKKYFGELHRQEGDRSDSILRERFVRGEIDEGQFRDMMEILAWSRTGKRSGDASDERDPL